jgi:archaeal flagellar protein FlaJ
MSSIALLQKLRGKGSSETAARPGTDEGSQAAVNKDEKTLDFDLFAQLSYMAALATAGISRSGLFDKASGLPYVSASYFKRINLAARKLNIDYAEACRIEAEATDNHTVRSLLLRMSGSLSSGEDEASFFLREAETHGEEWGKRYERDVESLKKWTDAYTSLIVASGLIVIVAIISMMIYPVGLVFVVGLAVAMVSASGIGAWIIYISAPREIVTRVSGPSSSKQLLVDRLFRILVPIAMIAFFGALFLGFGLGIGLILAGILVFPVGYLAGKDDGDIVKKDADMAHVVRVIGGVSSAMGTTVGEALEKLDRRSMGSMEPELERLRLRLRAGIQPELCWAALVDEAGSEVIERTTAMFTDSITIGGEPGKVGDASAYFSSKISYLRASRQLVAATFKWLVYPLHIAMVALLVFIGKIMGLFSLDSIANISSIGDGTEGQLGSSSLAVGDLFTFGQINMDMVDLLVTGVALVLTLANAFAPKAADGGSSIKFINNLAILMVVTGVIMVGVPAVADSLFTSILNNEP